MQLLSQSAAACKITQYLVLSTEYISDHHEISVFLNPEP
jgi:hypothetical protein